MQRSDLLVLSLRLQMTMFAAAFLTLLSVACMLAVPSSAVECGLWGAPCQAYYPNSTLNSSFVVSNIAFDGLQAGNFTWTRTLFPSLPLCPITYNHFIVYRFQSALFRKPSRQ